MSIFGTTLLVTCYNAELMSPLQPPGCWLFQRAKTSPGCFSALPYNGT